MEELLPGTWGCVANLVLPGSSCQFAGMAFWRLVASIAMSFWTDACSGSRRAAYSLIRF
jgi:hypothetical protein